MSKRDSVSILGSTGSIGKQTLSVIKEQKDKFKIESLAAGKNISLLLKQISEFKPTMVSVDSTKDQNLLKKEGHQSFRNLPKFAIFF